MNIDKTEPNRQNVKRQERVVTADQKNDKTWQNVNKAKEVINKTKKENR
jgi:hypothetical protein